MYINSDIEKTESKSDGYLETSAKLVVKFKKEKKKCTFFSLISISIHRYINFLKTLNIIIIFLLY